MSDDSRFVYLYCNANGVVVYVGRGDADRPTGDHSHVNVHFDYIEILDCGTSEGAKVAEGALISAGRRHERWHLANGRNDEYSFSPMGVPLHLTGREVEDRMSPDNIVAQAGGVVILVRVTFKRLSQEGRLVIDPARPDPAAIMDRIRHEWYLGDWVAAWSKGTMEPPVALVGVIGDKRRFIIGAVDLRGFDWGSLQSGKAVEFPQSLAETDDDLDAFGLRGRRITDWKFRQNYKFHVHGPRGEVLRPSHVARSSQK